MSPVSLPSNEQPEHWPPFWVRHERTVAIILMVVLVVGISFLIAALWPHHHARPVPVAQAPAAVVAQQPFMIGGKHDSLVRHMIGSSPVEKIRRAIRVAEYSHLEIWETKHGRFVRVLTPQEAWQLADFTNSHGIDIPVTQDDYFDPVHERFVLSYWRTHDHPRRVRRYT